MSNTTVEQFKKSIKYSKRSVIWCKFWILYGFCFGIHYMIISDYFLAGMMFLLAVFWVGLLHLDMKLLKIRNKTLKMLQTEEI